MSVEKIPKEVGQTIVLLGSFNVGVPFMGAALYAAEEINGYRPTIASVFEKSWDGATKALELVVTVDAGLAGAAIGGYAAAKAYTKLTQ